MFTGIIQAMGRVGGSVERDGDVRLTIDGDAPFLAQAEIGASIAVNGCCLTVQEKRPGGFVADVSRESLSLTNLGQLGEGSAVNLEPALCAGDPLGGHLVSGHVDGLGVVRESARDARSWRFRIGTPAELMPYVAAKGSITVDGVSLTVNDVGETDFGVNIVPHTFEHTLFGRYAEGSVVNLEVDLLARYIGRLLDARGRPDGA